MPRREPIQPPLLPGLTARQLIGSGGYADVFLYEQEMPTRPVAVKVLIAGGPAGGVGREQFTAEANLMARVSAHPYIVEIYQADISADGRPYLVMQYYPGPNFSDRAKREQMTVAEVLRTGVQLASAVETAHRAGIFHRDIKPANILTSQYNQPGLTDFGIASAHGPEEAVDGVSIPWAPPEALGDSIPDPRADIYSLAATLYNLLAGRSPFEIPGGDNTELALLDRIERHPLPSLGRTDVPASMERILGHAMAKAAAHRPQSAAEFGRQLQAIESELKLAITLLELAGESYTVRARTDADDDDSTRVKGITELQAQPGGLIREIGEARSAGAIRTERRREGLLAEPDVADTVHRGSRPEPVPLPASVSREVEGRYVLAAVAAAVLVGIVALALVLGGGDGVDPEAEAELAQFEVNDNLDAPVVAAPPPVTDLTGTANTDGTFTFTWASSGDQVTYAVSEDGAQAIERVSETSYVSTTACVEVESIGESGLLSAPTRGCV